MTSRATESLEELEKVSEAIVKAEKLKVKRALAALQEGWSLRQVAISCHVSVNTVQKWKAAAGVVFQDGRHELF